jgi:hypothetical protein
VTRERFADKVVDGALTSGRTLAAIGDPIGPDEQLRVEVLQACETAAAEEAVPQVTDGTFDLPLGVYPVRTAEARCEAAPAGELEETRVQARPCGAA